MPQDSVLYAVGRLRMLRRRMLSASQMQRLLSAADAQEAQRVLLEAGYITPEQPDAEKASMDRLLDASRMVSRLSPDPATTDSFLLRYDVLNLKTLLKARILGEEAEALSPGGTLDPEMLRHAVADHSYGRLPEPLKDAMEALEKRVAVSVDPMEIDVRLDQAMYRMMLDGLRKTRSPAARKWLEAKADFVNMRSYLRLRGMQASLSLADVLVPGGQMERKLRASGGENGDHLLSSAALTYGGRIAALASRAMEDMSQIGQLEKAMDEYLVNLFAQERMQPDSIDAVIDYLLQVEEQSADVRLIMAGKRNGFSQDEIAERLRGNYGR